MKPRDRIILACQDLIMEHGYRNFSMNQLAARAGVSKRTLYRYFSSRDAVIEECLDSFMHLMAQSLDNILFEEADPAKITKMAFAALIDKGSFALNPRSMDDLRRYYPHLWVKIDRFRQERIRYIFSYLSSQNNHPLFNDIDPRIALNVISASVQAVLNPDFILDNGFKFKDVVDQLSRLLINAFIAPSNCS